MPRNYRIILDRRIGEWDGDGYDIIITSDADHLADAALEFFEKMGNPDQTPPVGNGTLSLEERNPKTGCWEVMAYL